MDQNLFSSGGAARALGISRDALLWALRAGAPEPTVRVGGRRLFAEQDLQALRAWLAGRSRSGRFQGRIV